MTAYLKNEIFSTDISAIFSKHRWFQFQSHNKNYDFSYKGEVADYYLKLSVRDKLLNFEYVLDFQLPENKVYDLLGIINYINKISQNGHFFYDFIDDKIKFKTIHSFSQKPNKDNLKQIVDINMSPVNSLFHKFSMAIHNLVYGEKIDQNVLKFLFLNIEGNA